MGDYKLTREETETVIRTSAADREWDFWTIDPKFVRRLEKLGYVLKRDHQGGWSCRVPLDRIAIRRPEKRKMSEKQRGNIARAQAVRKSSTGLKEISGDMPKQTPSPSEAA